MAYCLFRKEEWSIHFIAAHSTPYVTFGLDLSSSYVICGFCIAQTMHTIFTSKFPLNSFNALKFSVPKNTLCPLLICSRHLYDFHLLYDSHLFFQIMHC
ncbi:hypothetical protein C0J52_08018 [Blattella germanica]|nr:hypothetical protein C0J52_08018 [Blattella germanica]